MFLPLELVREIVAFSHCSSSSSCSTELGVSTKQNWSSIEPLTLASKSYRALALEAWFRVLFLRAPSDVTAFFSIFRGFESTPRVLHCVQPNNKKTQLWDLRGLKHLHKLRLDWLSTVIMPHYGSKDSADRLPFLHVSPTVKELELYGLPWPSPLVFRSIHIILPNLRALRLRQQRIWCGLCHTCCVSRFKSPGPDKIIYTDGSGLPMHYAHALLALQHLHTVSLTIADFGSGRTTLKNDAEHNPYLWAGECDRCMDIMYEDSSFRDKWVARKKGVAMTDREHQLVYIALPALKRVEWNFWREEGSEEADDDSMQESGDEVSGEERDS